MLSIADLVKTAEAKVAKRRGIRDKVADELKRKKTAGKSTKTKNKIKRNYVYYPDHPEMGRPVATVERILMLLDDGGVIVRKLMGETDITLDRKIGTKTKFMGVCYRIIDIDVDSVDLIMRVEEIAVEES